MQGSCSTEWPWALPVWGDVTGTFTMKDNRKINCWNHKFHFRIRTHAVTQLNSPQWLPVARYGQVQQDLSPCCLGRGGVQTLQ